MSESISPEVTIHKLKRELEQARRKAASETQANMSLIDANTLLVEKDRLLMFDMKKLEEENKQLKNILNQLEEKIKNYSIYYKSIEVKYVIEYLNKLKEDIK